MIDQGTRLTATATTFEDLVEAIRAVHERMSAQAGRAVNISLTLRNWIIGHYIEQYELRGRDRAAYGERMFQELAKRLTKHGISNSNRRQLYRYLEFRRVYPQIVRTLSPQLRELVEQGDEEGGEKVGTPSPQLVIPAETLVSRLSYSHFELLTVIEDDFKRIFYEAECMRGNWSVRELKRQIGALYFERSGLSKNKEKLAKMVQSGIVMAEPRLAVRDPYVFEFLNLRSREVMGESDLEDALLDRLHDFLLELGNGFCFEARQKRVLIGNTHNFVDLVFYHRILKCHVLIELKVSEFTHEHMGQLNTYVSWYKRNMMTKGDSPPVGILLCTQKDRAMVEYALADLDNSLFVSKYQLELPHAEEIERFLVQQMELEGKE